MSEALDWDGDWNAIVSEAERKSLSEELARELCPSHILHGIGATAVGRRWRRDDVLFRLADGRLAQVHLTWQAETNPDWPSTEIYQDFEAWKAVPVEDR